MSGPRTISRSCDLFFIFIIIFTMINQPTCSFPYFLEYVLLFLDDTVDEEGE